MRISTSILLFFFSLSLLSRTDLLSFIKKVKCPIELSASEDYDESADPDQNKKPADAKEELENDEKRTHFITFNSSFIFFKDIRYTKLFLDYYKQLFKSHFKEIVCPPPESV